MGPVPLYQRGPRARCPPPARDVPATTVHAAGRGPHHIPRLPEPRRPGPCSRRPKARSSASAVPGHALATAAGPAPFPLGGGRQIYRCHATRHQAGLTHHEESGFPAHEQPRGCGPGQDPSPEHGLGGPQRLRSAGPGLRAPLGRHRRGAEAPPRG